jgi:hypothetical protein
MSVPVFVIGGKSCLRSIPDPFIHDGVVVKPDGQLGRILKRNSLPYSQPTQGVPDEVRRWVINLEIIFFNFLKDWTRTVFLVTLEMSWVLLCPLYLVPVARRIIEWLKLQNSRCQFLKIVDHLTNNSRICKVAKLKKCLSEIHFTSYFKSNIKQLMLFKMIFVYLNSDLTNLYRIINTKTNLNFWVWQPCKTEALHGCQVKILFKFFLIIFLVFL